MNKQDKTKLLLKILIGAAWIDGVIQQEERQYLNNMAQEKGFAENPEIKPLLSELRVVQPVECYAWLKTYLGESPTQEDYQNLFGAISALIYSDSNVDVEEAKLLNRLQLLDPAKEEPQSAFDKLLKSIQKLYRRSIGV